MKSGSAIIFVSVAALCLSCAERASGPDNASLMDASRQELATALAERDRLLGLVKEMSADMEQIRGLEDIVALNGTRSGEDRSQEARLRADLAAVKKTLARRRQKLAELEEGLRESGQLNDELVATIAAFRKQIAYQTADIERLQARLALAGERIEALTDTVDSLSVSMANVSGEYNAFRTASADRESALNRCYYVVADKSELRRHRILEGGFLRRTKLLEGDFDHDFFTAADRRELSGISLRDLRHIKVLTRHPDDSYTIADGRLVITDPARFWELSNYLVVEAD